MAHSTIYTHIGELLEQLADKARIVVEPGCGSKQYSRFIKGLHIGFDIDNRYPGGNPDIKADAENAPIKSNSVDLIFFVACFHLFPNTNRVLTECRRMLRRGGRLIIFDYNWWVISRLRRNEDGVKHSLSSLRLVKSFEQMGFKANIHWQCVPLKGPRFCKSFFSLKLFRFFIYLISNWIVVSGVKK